MNDSMVEWRKLDTFNMIFIEIRLRVKKNKNAVCDMYHLTEVELDPLLLLLFDQLEKSLGAKVKAMGKTIKSSVVKSVNTQHEHFKNNCDLQDSGRI